MRLGIAKIDQQAIAEILRNMPVKALDDLSTGRVVRAHDLPVVFWIKLTGEHGRIHQVTEEDGELAPLGVGGTRPRGRRGDCGGGVLAALLRWPGRVRGRAR